MDFLGTINLEVSKLQHLREANILCDLIINVVCHEDPSFGTASIAPLKIPMKIQSFHCHKVMLIATSTFFSSLLEANDFNDSSITLPPLVSPIAFEILMDCIYGEILTLNLISSKLNEDSSI